jgi:hypothetical protein
MPSELDLVCDVVEVGSYLLEGWAFRTQIFTAVMLIYRNDCMLSFTC